MNINAEVTTEARDYLVALLTKQEVPGMAARVYVDKGGTQHAETCLAFCPPGEESAGDIRKVFDELVLYFDAASAPYLQDMEIGVQGRASSSASRSRRRTRKSRQNRPKRLFCHKTVRLYGYPTGTPPPFRRGRLFL